MSCHALTIDILEHLYVRLAEHASLSRRSVADEALAAVALMLPTGDNLTPALTRVLHDLDALDDAQLRRAATRPCPSAGELTIIEAVLLDRLESTGLIRAKATALLRVRGYEVSAL